MNRTQNMNASKFNNYQSGEENKTIADGFGQRTDKLQRQERNDSEKQVQQKSAHFKELLSFWQSGAFSSAKDNSQNMSASELLKTDSTTINQLQNVSVTGWPQDHRLKKAYSMNSLLGLNQHESIFSQEHKLERMHSMNSLLDSNRRKSISREENKTRTGRFGQRSDRLQAKRQQKVAPEQQIEQKSANESLLKLKQFFEQNIYQSKIMSELPKTDSTADSQRITVPVTGWPQDQRPKIAFSTNILPGSNQYEFKPVEISKSKPGGYYNKTDRLQGHERNDQENHYQHKPVRVKESKSPFWASKSLSPGLVRSQSMNALELSMADVTLNQPQNVSVTGWQDPTLKRTYDRTVVPGSNQLETASIEVDKSKTGGYCNKTDILQGHERNDQENQYQHEPVRVKESKSPFWASKSLSPGLVRSQSMNALELSMADVTLNQPQNVSVTGWQDPTLKRTYSRIVVPGSNQLETTSSCKNTRHGEHKSTETDAIIQENRKLQQFVRDSTSNNSGIYKKCNTTPLHISSSKGFSHIVKYLIAKGANVNLCDDEGLSPLFLACFSEHTEIIKILLEHGADVNKASPLCTMCEFGNVEIVRILLNNGANVDVCNYEGLSPLFFACYNEHTEIIKILLEHDADVNMACPLCIMCKLGNSEIVRILLNNGANVNLCDDKGRSPLYLACYSNHNEIVKILLDNDADVNISRPFRIRNAFRNAEIVQMLITNGADVSLCNDDDKDMYI